MFCYVKVLQSMPADQCLDKPLTCSDAEILSRFAWLFPLPFMELLAGRNLCIPLEQVFPLSCTVHNPDDLCPFADLTVQN